MRRLLRQGHLASFLLLASCVPAARGGQPDVAPTATLRLRYDFAALMRDDPLAQTEEDSVAGGNSPAPPFYLAAAEGAQADRATDCLTAALYYEARSEGDEGQRAVAQVVLNRVRHREYPSTICGVVFQRGPGPACQFSFTCDGSMRARREPAAWAEARRIAREALAGSVYAPVGMATHYHTRAVRPGWGRTLAQVVTIGAHIFYRSRGEDPAFAFARRTAAAEPPVRVSAVAAPRSNPPQREEHRHEATAAEAIAPVAPSPGFAFLVEEGPPLAAADAAPSDGR